MKNSLATLAFAAVALSQLGATDCGQAISNPGFDLWCGDAPCSWKVERGSIAKVPTWNKGDFGLSFVGSDVAIEQVSPLANTDGNCLEFDLVANVDDNAEVDLNIDVFADGTIEHTERIPTSHWQPISFKLPITGTYGGVRFELVKHGDGNAVVAQVGAQVSSGCGGLTAIAPAPAPNGSPCADNTGCRSGICGTSAEGIFAGQCLGCTNPNQCQPSETCDLGAPSSPVRGVPLECVPLQGHQLGEQCFFDPACAPGLYCTSGVCSTCKTDGTGCTGGETCAPAWPIVAAFTRQPAHTPFVCSPNAMRRATGEPCASNADCASGACAGTARMECDHDDGRACANASDCPFTNLNNGACDTVGVQGGTCQ